jgi:hypothetical protein
MVCMLALGRTSQMLVPPVRWERKSGFPVSLPFFFCVFAVSGVESVFVPFVFGLRCIGIKLVRYERMLSYNVTIAIAQLRRSYLESNLPIDLMDHHYTAHNMCTSPRSPTPIRSARLKVGSYRFASSGGLRRLSKYGVIESGWNKRKDQPSDISRIFATCEPRQLSYVHQQKSVRCRTFGAMQSLRDRFSGCDRVREDAWNDDLSRCCSWLVAFAASLAWLCVLLSCTLWRSVVSLRW